MKRNLTILLAIAAILLLLWAALKAGRTSDNPVLSVEGGKIQGVKEEGFLVYKGIPFAAPPTGERRGKVLQEVIPWKGILKADRFAPAAVQTPVSKDDPLYYKEFYAEGYPEFSEDCMYLNVWAPPGTVGKPGSKVPVAVWIHGGAFAHGYSFEKEMDGAEWARRGVILVTIPYRVGDLGFGTDGMLGFEDQVTALRWVRDNISTFGGNPDNVTVFGQSAGAISVKYLFTLPQARSLFAKAIIQSGGGVNVMSNPPFLPEGTRGENMAQAMEEGCFDGKPILIGWTAQDPAFLGKESSLEFSDLRADRDPGTPLYVYDFARNLPGEAEGEPDFGAFHTAELWYMFGTLDRAWRPFTEADHELSQRMLDAWTGFARSSDPGWETYTKEHPFVQVFDTGE